MVKIESKEKLAKLLAMEDLDIQHKQVRTAMFDVKNRCLILPIWKDVSNDVYDLLVGHEVGHALYTPNNEEKLKSLIKKTSKHCVNVVEDARIESLIKRKYPGLVKSFYKGYQSLVERDFFGLSEMDFDNINLLDKLNLKFKVPSAIEGVVEFNETEQSFVDRIEKIKKFDELEKICIDICEYIKENRTEDDEQESKYFDQDSENYSEMYENEEYEIDESGEDAETETETEQGSSKEENEESEETDSDEEKDSPSDSDEGEGEEDSDLDKDQDRTSTGTASPDYENEMDSTPQDLRAETIENFEKELDKLTDKKGNNAYLTIPESNGKNINDYKKVWKSFNEYYDINSYREIASKGEQAIRSRYDWGFTTEGDFVNESERIFKNAKTTLDEIKKESSKNVAHMAMEFERKKSADIYKRTLIAKTGVLDTNKLFSAKYNEDVFKKSVRVPDGKNHGLCMFVDWSGSMAVNMAGCIKQLIELMLFCKKVNIPFEVYSFTDVTGQKPKSFNYRHGNLMTDNFVTMNNYFSSRMSTKEFNEALVNILVISNSFRGGYQYYPIPEGDRLGYTPLNGAVITSEKIIKEFKQRNNIQKVHAVWITDGEGNNMYSQFEISPECMSGKETNINKYENQVYLQDHICKKNYEVKGRHLTPYLFEIVKNRLDCNVVGFYLDSNFGKKTPMMKYWYESIDHKYPRQVNHGKFGANEFVQKAKKDGFIISKKGGYDEYYVIGNAPVVIKTTEIEEKMTARRMATLFSAKSNKFKKSRVILSRFIDLITV